jgi:hypothetical protein
MDINTITNTKIIKNIFTEEELTFLYSEINNIIKEDYVVQEVLGRLYSILYWKEYKEENNGSINLKINKKIFDKIIDIAEKKLNKQLELESISFTRYSKQYGSPNLHPHVDTKFKTPRLTFDIQLDSNLDWAIVVEGESSILKNNEALIFSGTNEVHWREKKVFNDDEYLDMLLCQFSEKTTYINEISPEFIKERDIRQKTIKDNIMEKTTLEMINGLSEISEYMEDEDLTTALTMIAKLIIKPDIPIQVATLEIVRLQAIAAKLSLKATWMANVDKNNRAKKNIYYTAAESVNNLVSALKYITK